MPAARTYSESIEVAAPPAAVYALVSDVTRTGEWSPICTSCRWDEGDAPAPGASPQVGAHFTGHNEVPGRTWETRSEVVAADPGREFAWVVGQGFARWGYTVRPLDGGTRTELTESWEFTPTGMAFFAEKYGEDAGAQIEARTRMAHEGIPATLAAIRRIAEA
ncbi:SRPBCC family protein [Isoptericola aurantiacus]|uniref:SRPBCC family protein n=1 Tax=Isoptericola aurantiacus TaxID=3377839 RepID=UPI00383BE2B3